VLQYVLETGAQQLHLLVDGEVGSVVPCARQILLFYMWHAFDVISTTKLQPPWMLKTIQANHVAELASRGSGISLSQKAF
jgi:hypothetical protein